MMTAMTPSLNASIRLFVMRGEPASAGIAASGGVEHCRLSVSGQGIGRATLGDADGAILELRDLAERIEHRIRQQVRGGLVVAERNEYAAARRAIVGAGVQRYAAAARCDGDGVARRYAERAQIGGVHRGHGERL